MSRFITKARIEVSASINLTESELRALEALASYDVEQFLKFFYGNIGTHALKPHESGIRSLFAAVRSEVPALLQSFSQARKAFEANP